MLPNTNARLKMNEINNYNQISFTLYDFHSIGMYCEGNKHVFASLSKY